MRYKKLLLTFLVSQLILECSRNSESDSLSFSRESPHPPASPQSGSDVSVSSRKKIKKVRFAEGEVTDEHEEDVDFEEEEEEEEDVYKPKRSESESPKSGSFVDISNGDSSVDNEKRETYYRVLTKKREEQGILDKFENKENQIFNRILELHDLVQELLKYKPDIDNAFSFLENLPAGKVHKMDKND